MYFALACSAALLFVYSLISEKVERLSLSGPIVFVAVGAAMGPLGLKWFNPSVNFGNGKLLIDLTLALFLFVDAASADLPVLKKNWRIPGRMLLLGLPVTMLLGAVLALMLFPAFSVYEAAILGVMLAATDAALGKAVVTNQGVPAHLREGLSAESGLNDGLAVPFLLLFIALEKGAAVRGEGVALELLAEEVGIGLAVSCAFCLIVFTTFSASSSASSGWWLWMSFLDII